MTAATTTAPRQAAGPTIDAPTTGQLVRRTAAVNEWDEGYKRLIVQTILRPKDRDPTPGEIAMFAEQVQRTGLDPFLKQIYGIYRYDSRVGGEVLQTQVGIDGFRLIAHRTRIYEGQDGPYWCGPDAQWRDVWLDSNNRPPSAAKVGVWMRGARSPVWGVARFEAYAQRKTGGALMGLWVTMPDNQIAKCAEAQALRKAFPADLSGLYIPEEFDQATNPDPMPVGTAATVLAAGAVELITKKRAQEIVDRTWSLGLDQQLQLAATTVTGDDPGDCSTKSAATEALRKLTVAQANELERWLSRRFDEITTDEEESRKESGDA